MTSVLLFLLGALPAIAADPEPSALPVGVYAQFQHEPPQTVLDAVHQEVGSIMAPIGLRMIWPSLDRNASESWPSLAVVRFKGSCDTVDLSVYRPYPFVLGQTDIVDGKVIPFCNIYCNAIRAMLASRLTSLEPDQRGAAFGRAVGRVLAHELYHALAKTKHHGSRGVGEPAYSADNLLMDEFRFDNGQVRKLQRTLLPSFLQFAGAIPRAAPVGLSLFIESGCVGCHGTHGEGTVFGPAIRSLANSYGSAELSRRLNAKGPLMYERARRLGALWPPLGEKDVKTLAAFLRSLAPDTDRVAVAGAH